MTFSLPFSIWLMVTYFRTIPRELEEAAMVDGTTAFGAAIRIAMPLAVPGMIVAFVFSLLIGWNDVLYASVLTNSSTQTLAVALQSFLFTEEGGGAPKYTDLMAAGVVGAIPVIVIYLALQRFLIGGLAAGGVK
jgi:multiple sugar transport system permease protein